MEYPYHPLVYGVGYIGEGKYKPTKNNRITKEYSTWNNMLKRCYNKKLQEKLHTYRGCTVCNEWKNFQVFAKWFEGNHVEGFHLDKDLLVNGNKVYSKKTCAFIPQELNKFITNNKSNNTSGHIGVSWNKKMGKWMSNIRDCDTHRYIRLGYFTDPQEASNSYAKARAKMTNRMREKMINEYNITDTRILDAIR